MKASLLFKGERLRQGERRRELGYGLMRDLRVRSSQTRFLYQIGSQFVTLCGTYDAACVSKLEAGAGWAAPRVNPARPNKVCPEMPIV